MLNPVKIFSVSQIHYFGSQNTLYVQPPLSPPLKKLIFNIKIPLVFLNKTLITIRLIRRHTFSVFQCCFYISITFFMSYHSWTRTCHSFHTSFNCLSMDREVRNFYCECQSMQLGRLSTYRMSEGAHGFRSSNQWCLWYLHIASLSLALWKVEQICHLLPELSASSSDPPLICSHASTPTLGLQHVTGWSVVNCVLTLTTDELISLTVTI